MLEYILTLFNEIIPFNEFSLYLINNLAITNNDTIVLSYFMFIFLIFIVLLFVVLALLYFIKHTRNVWFGRRRY